jgi:hypothetical protein
MGQMIDRMVRAARLDATVYEEVEADASATWQTVGVVVLSSLCAGIGTGVESGIRGVVVWTLFHLVFWYAWAYLMYVIGTRILPEAQTESNVGELLRTIGFSSAPGVLRIVGVIPGARSIVFVVVTIWMLAAMVIAVRQALDYTSTVRAVGVCSLGCLIVLMLIFFVISPLAGTAFLPR